MTRHLMRNALAVSVLLLLISGGMALAATPREVDNAIKKGVEFLYSKQPWEGNPGAHDQEGGLACMATYALLAAGESPQDGRMKQAVDLVKGLPLQGTYAIGMRAQIYQFLQKAGNAQAIRNDAMLLGDRMRMKERMTDKERKDHAESDGLFRYAQKDLDYDHSCSNYGVLGMWAIAETNFEVPTLFWQKSEAAWLRHQHEDGSWSYVGGGSDTHDDQKGWEHQGTMSMTSAGVATLFITQEYLHGMEGLRCTGNVSNPAIEAGIRWMSQHMDKIAGERTYYTWYNVERVGTASGLKYFGTVDWYKDGADYLVKHQGGDGNWGSIPDTCFSILFLVRGRAPVMMNKLDYAVNTNGDRARQPTWNQRPRDIANLAKHTGKQIEKYLNWQIVNLKVDVSELHDAPILYISGKDALLFTPEEEAKLKRFVEQGGLILGNADCASTAFAMSFRKLGTKLFGWEFRDLPAGHPIYTDQQYRRESWRTKPRIEGLTNGARELMLIYPNNDPAQGWQTHSFLGPEREALAQSASNIFLYAVDKQNLRSKGETYIVHAKGGTVQKTLGVARIKYPGNWDPEPGGWRRLAAVMENDQQTKLVVNDVELGSGKLNNSYAIAHLTGTARMSLSQPAREEIKKYVEGGGTLLVDACGGSGEFGLVAEEEIRKTFPEGKLAILAIGHPMYSVANKIEEVEYRPFARKNLGNIHTPRVRAMEINGRAAIFFSAEDLSVGLVGMPVDGINGYIPFAQRNENGTAASRMGATEIVSNIILYAASKNPNLGQAPAPDKVAEKTGDKPHASGAQKPAKSQSKRK
jgi:hypothetical protein